MVSAQIIPRKIQNIVNACLSHAQDLLSTSQKILDKEGLPNIAYHLAVVALEEIGKSELIAMNHLAQTQEYEFFGEKYFEDHVRKLFWALWGPSFGREVIAKDQIEIYQGLASKIHDIRLRALYVSPTEASFILPRRAVKKSEAQALISLAKSRLDLEKALKFKPLSKTKQLDISWFLDSTKDPEKRRMIMGSKSMEKLAELGHSYKWIKWLRLNFEEAEVKAQAQMERELKRVRPSSKEALQEKWKLKIRFYTNSHSIRPKPLNWWNGRINWIKLYPIGRKKNELLVEFTLPKGVSVHGLWWTGWGAARRFITAINIGSMGFFWWYVPEQISRYYEKIMDIEENSEMVVERSPRLMLDWKKEALLERDLRHTQICFSMLPRPSERKIHEPFNYYLTGLGFLSKNDIHIQFEANAFEQFYKSLKAGMHTYKDWDGTSPFSDAFNAMMLELSADKEGRKKYIKLGKKFEKEPIDPSGITLEEAGMMKTLCDAYFLYKFYDLADRRKAKEEKAKSTKKKITKK